MHIASLVKIPCYLLRLSSRNKNMGVSRTDNSVNIWRICPLAIPNQISTISMHSPVKIHWYYSSYHPEMKNGWMDRHTEVQCETIIPCHYCMAGYKNYQNIPKGSSAMAIFPNWSQTDGQTLKDSQGDYRALFKSQPFDQSTFLQVMQ